MTPNQRFVSSTVNMEILPSHLRLIVMFSLYLIIFLKQKNLCFGYYIHVNQIFSADAEMSRKYEKKIEK